MKPLTEDQLKIRALGEEMNAKAREALQEKKEPTAQEIINEI